MANRRMALLFLGLLFLAFLVLTEAGLSVLHFQQTAPESLALIHYGAKVRRAWSGVLWPDEVGIWQVDERFGFSHIPHASGMHATRDYEVTYTIGGRQERLVPHSQDAQRTILFLGGSCTFGQGVSDDQAFPASLAKLWTSWNIQNRAVSGWGTSHAFLALEDVLERDSVAAAIYCLVPHHLRRNYIRKSWVTGVGRYDLKHPHFELDDGVPVFRGVVGPNESAPDNGAVRHRELALTTAMLTGMKEKCEAAGIPFVVVLLPRMTEDSWPPQLIEHLYKSEALVLDLSEMRLDRFEHDAHPNASDHARIARRIHQSFVTGLLE